MVDHFFSGLAAVSPILPPLVRTMIIAIVAMIAWAILSIPAFWICRTLGVSLYSGAAQLSLLRKRLFSATSTTFRNCVTPIEQFAVAHAQMFSFADENQQIKLELAKLRGAVESIPTKIRALESSIVDAGNKFIGAAETISNLEIPLPVPPPGPQEFSAIRKTRNKAVVILVATILVTPALIIFNTFMLSQFLEGFSQGTEFAGVPLSILLAGFMTIVEITLGVLLGAFPGRHLQLLWLTSIGGLAFIECTFYALMGQGFNRSLFDAFYAPDPAPAWTKMWFGIFGPILVFCLAGVGHALFSSITQLSELHVIRQWRGYITSRVNFAKRLRERLSDAERAKELLIATLDEVQQNLGATREIANSNVALIEKSRDGLLQQVKIAEAIRLVDNRRLDRGAMLRQFIECLIYCGAIFIALGMLATIYSSAIITSPFFTLTGWLLGGTVATAQSVVLLLAGSAITRANATMSASESIPATNVPHTTLGTIAGASILTIFIVGDAAYALHNFNALNLFILAFLLAADLALFWTGSKLGLIGAAVWSLLLSLSYAAGAAVVGGVAVAVAIAESFLIVSRIVLLILAYPFSLMFFRDMSGAQLIPRPAV